MNRATRSHAIEQSARVTERNATIHASGRLLAELGLRHVMMELIPILNTLHGRTVQRQLTQIIDKSCRFAHSQFQRRDAENAERRRAKRGAKSRLGVEGRCV